MVTSRRERLHHTTRSEIKDLARKQMAAEGTAAISLRAIAREMGVSAPALYRYYESRDDLITALILEAYNHLADTIEAARAAQAATDYAQQLYAATMAYRAWALAHPADYVLILGNPIPGYQAPADLTMPAARRTMNVFIDLIESARQAGALTLPDELTTLLPTMQAGIIGNGPHYGVDMPHPTLEFVLSMWGRLHGLISLELFNHLQPIIASPGELYRFEVLTLLQRLGLPIESLQSMDQIYM